MPTEDLKVRLDRKPKIWCLNPVGLPNSTNCVGHSLLIVQSEKMFDYGIAEGDVEAGIFELPKIRGVTNNGFDVGKALWLCLQIESNDLDVISIHPTPVFPKQICAPDIEDTQGPGQG